MNKNRKFLTNRSVLALITVTCLFMTDVRLVLADELILEEIVVTARKRQESLRDVPIAVTAFSADVIQAARIEQFADFVALTPGVTLREQFSPSFTNLTVRGIATQQNGELPIALAVDGVTLPFTSFLNQDLLDVEQIEILKGPQGGLYGRNAIAGAVNISTRKPGNELDGKLRASYGNGDYKQITGSVSGPVIKDSLYGKLGFSYKDSDGLIDNQSSSDELDFIEEITVFGRILYEVSPELTVDFRGKYTSADVGASYFSELPAAQLDSFSDSTDPIISDPAVDDRELYEFTGKLDYEGRYGTFTSITGYFDVEDLIYGDADFGIPAWGAEFGIFQDFRTTIEGWSQEVRFTSPADQDFRWIIGAFYQDRENSTFTDIQTDIGAGFPESVFLVEDSTNDSESWAVFGQADYDVTDKFELSVAMRYDEDKRNTVDQAVSGEQLSKTFSEFQPKVTLSYALSNDYLMYATWAKGFRSGGFNGFAAPLDNRSFDEEVSTTYEAGIKATLVDGRITADASIYHIEYEDQQFFFFIDTFTSLIVNADETTIDGLELEIAMRISDQLDLYASYGFTDGEITEDNNPPDANFGSFIGNVSPGSNRYTLNLGAQYTVSLGGSGLEWTTRADFERRGPIYYEFNNRDKTQPVDLVNIRTAIQNESWSLAFFARNLTNEQYPLTAESLVPDLGPDRVFRLPSQPRFYGIELSYHF